MGGDTMSITTIKGLYRHIKQNSGFSGRTIHSVILSLGYNLRGKENDFKNLSNVFKNCSKHGADTGITGFSFYTDIAEFFFKHHIDIVSHLEKTAKELDLDVLFMIKDFRLLRHSDFTLGEIGKALWHLPISADYFEIYPVFVWYALEEISCTWRRYLEEHPALAEKLSA